MNLSLASVAEKAEHLATLSPAEDFAQRQELTHVVRDDDYDTQTRMGAYCLVISGADAPQEYAVQLARHDMVSEAIEKRQLLVAMKQFYGQSTGPGDYSFLQVFIPRTPFGYWAYAPGSRYDYETRERKPQPIEAHSSIVTYEDRFSDLLAHSTGSLLDPHAETRDERKSIKEFFKTGNAPFGLYSLGVMEGKVWFNSSVWSREDAVSTRSELDGDSLHGLYTPDQFLAAFTSERRRRRDQIRVLSVFSMAIAQAEAENPGFAMSRLDPFIADSFTRKAGAAQFANDRNVSLAVERDLSELIQRGKKLHPISERERRQRIEQEQKTIDAEKARRIAEKLETLPITITSFDIETGPGTSISLEELYAKAEEEGYFIYEFRVNDNSFEAAVGNRQSLEEAGIDLSEGLTLGTMFHTSIPGSGPTRELAVQRALDTWHSMQTDNAENPFGSISLFATAVENGELAKAFIPNTPSQPLEATVVVTTGDEEVPHTTFNIKMQDAPVFEVSERDKQAILEGLAGYFVDAQTLKNQT